MWIDHRKEIRPNLFTVANLHFNPVDKTKLSCNASTDAAPQFL